METIKILLVDDRAEIRRSLSRIIGRATDMEVVGQAGDGQEALERIEELRPDVVVMDIEMPVLDGIEATRIVKRRWPEIKVLAFTGLHGPELMDDLKGAGAVAHLEKTRAAELLCPLITAIATAEKPDVIVLDDSGATLFR